MASRVIAAEQLDAAMQQLASDVAQHDYSRVLAECHFQILAGVAENFSREEDRFGAKWPARKDKKPHPLLRLTYALYAAAATHGGTGQVERIGANSSVLGISLATIPYARAQNFGYPEGNLPAREYFYISDETEAKLAATIEEQVFQELF